MEAWYPKAELHPTAGDGGAMVGGAPRGVLHTTETVGWAGAPYYHIEYHPESRVFRQYRPFTRAARGLRHPSRTPQTNRQGDVCVQVAVVAYAKDAGKWSDETYADLAEFIGWCNAEFGIEAFSRADVGWGGEAYGVDGAGRMIWDEWLEHGGWCGHQEVPGNTHWDAGRVDWTRLLEDDMAVLTTEEQEQLRKMLVALDNIGSSVYFVEPSVLIARALDEGEPELGIAKLLGGTPDVEARKSIEDLEAEIEELKETLRSV